MFRDHLFGRYSVTMQKNMSAVKDLQGSHAHKNSPTPPRTTPVPYAKAYGRVLVGCVLL